NEIALPVVARVAVEMGSVRNRAPGVPEIGCLKSSTNKADLSISLLERLNREGEGEDARARGPLEVVSPTNGEVGTYGELVPVEGVPVETFGADGAVLSTAVRAALEREGVRAEICRHLVSGVDPGALAGIANRAWLAAAGKQSPDSYAIKVVDT